MGSKSKICEKVCRLFPKADNFYDVFGGGFSISHFMLLHRRNHYKQFHYNELRKGMGQLIQDAIAGKYSYENYSPEWISREDFSKRRENEPFVKIIWSFGNNGETYLFGKEIEERKRSMHYAICFNQFDDFAREVFGMERFKDGLSITDKRLFLKNRIKDKKMDRLDLQQLQQLERLQQLQQLEQLPISYTELDYSKVEIKPHSVIYCDPPYKGTADYQSKFNTEKFLDWANEIREPLFISEYNISDKRFKKIASFDKRSLLSINKDNKLVKEEGVWVNRAGYIKLLGGK
jgi:site-specific DNA-adenine methylase